MRPLIPFKQAQEQLRNAACRYRIRRHPKGQSPFVIVYETKGAKRAKTVRGCQWDNPRQLAVLVGYLLAAPAGGLNWDCLDTFRDDGDEISIGRQTWGELRALVQSWCAPGGIKARDRNAFSCFGPDGYFARHFPDEAIARTVDLEEFCLYSVASLDAYHRDPRRPKQPREYNSRGFYDALHMVSFLAKQDVAIATPELVAELVKLKKRAGHRKVPAPKFIPSTQEVQDWLDALIELDPFRGWCMAMMATYGLRNHELWHLEALPGEDPDEPTLIQISKFDCAHQGVQTKTGARPALACPAAWVERYGLNDLSHSRQMLQRLRRMKPIQSAVTAAGVVQVFNNADLGRVICHWFKHAGKSHMEFPVVLYGSYEPPRLPGQPKRAPVRGRCTNYGLRHAWALRAKAETTWSTALKAASMGHSESTHSRQYLRGETMEIKRQNMLRLKALDEGRQQTIAPVEPVPISDHQNVVEMLKGLDITPDLLLMAAQLKVITTPCSS